MTRTSPETRGRRLHVGVALGAPGDRDPITWHATLLDRAVRAEELGLRSVWIPESHFAGPGSIPAPLLLLSAIAARTRTLLLGTSSYLLPVRHPIRAAEDVAVLDQLSGGRLILGVGRGFRRPLFEAFGVPASEKRERFEVVLQTLLRAWTGEAVDAHGTVVSPQPAQKPHPPIWVAAFGPKALAQVARLGLPYLASPLETLERLRENHARHRDGLPEGHDPATLDVPAIRTVFVSRNASTLRSVREGLEIQSEAIARQVGRQLPHAGSAPVETFALLGEPEAVADQIEAYRDTIGLSHLIARVQVPGAEDPEVEASLELLAELSDRHG